MFQLVVYVFLGALCYASFAWPLARPPGQRQPLKLARLAGKRPPQLPESWAGATRLPNLKTHGRVSTLLRPQRQGVINSRRLWICFAAHSTIIPKPKVRDSQVKHLHHGELVLLSHNLCKHPQCLNSTFRELRPALMSGFG